MSVCIRLSINIPVCQPTYRCLSTYLRSCLYNYCSEYSYPYLSKYLCKSIDLHVYLVYLSLPLSVSCENEDDKNDEVEDNVIVFIYIAIILLNKFISAGRLDFLCHPSRRCSSVASSTLLAISDIRSRDRIQNVAARRPCT